MRDRERERKREGKREGGRTYPVGQCCVLLLWKKGQSRPITPQLSERCSWLLSAYRDAHEDVDKASQTSVEWHGTLWVLHHQETERGKQWPQCQGGVREERGKGGEVCGEGG